MGEWRSGKQKTNDKDGVEKFNGDDDEWTTERQASRHDNRPEIWIAYIYGDKTKCDEKNMLLYRKLFPLVLGHRPFNSIFFITFLISVAR